MTTEEQAAFHRLAETVAHHEIGCLCGDCETWRCAVDPEYASHRHPDDCTCEGCALVVALLGEVAG